jgi:hypothetical protein
MGWQGIRLAGELTNACPKKSQLKSTQITADAGSGHFLSKPSTSMVVTGREGRSKTQGAIGREIG